MINVLLVSPKMDNPNGGIAVWTDGYLAKCPQNGINCTLVNTAPVGARAKNGSAARNFGDEYVRTKYIFRELAKALKAQKFDAVHINSPCGTFGIIRDYYIVKKIRKVQPKARISVHFRCDIQFQIRNSTSKRYLGKLVKKVDSCLVLNDTSREYLRREFGVEGIKVPNFLNDAYIIEQPKEIREELKKAFFVGRVSVAKGAREMFEVAKRCPDIQFLLAGALGEGVDTWEKPENIVLLGSTKHDQVLSLMDESDVFFFPSHSEGFSIALTEAMARGLPTVTTKVGANADMLEDQGGIVVSVGDVDAMEKALKAMQPKAVRAKMSAWALDKVKNTYTSDAVLQLLCKIYTGK